MSRAEATNISHQIIIVD